MVSSRMLGQQGWAFPTQFLPNCWVGELTQFLEYETLRNSHYRKLRGRERLKSPAPFPLGNTLWKAGCCCTCCCFNGVSGYQGSLAPVSWDNGPATHVWPFWALSGTVHDRHCSQSRMSKRGIVSYIWKSDPSLSIFNPNYIQIHHLSLSDGLEY